MIKTIFLYYVPKKGHLQHNNILPPSKTVPPGKKDVSVQPFEYPLDTTEGPAEVFLFDDERRGEANHVVVGFFAEKTFSHQFLAKSPGAAGLRLELDADQEPPAPDFFYMAAPDSLALFGAVSTPARVVFAE